MDTDVIVVGAGHNGLVAATYLAKAGLRIALFERRPFVGGAAITDVFFTFSNTAGAPRYQDIGIGDLTFTPVPEINPALAASLSCCAAVGLTVFLKRRVARRAACQAA